MPLKKTPTASKNNLFLFLIVPVATSTWKLLLVDVLILDILILNALLPSSQLYPIPLPNVVILLFVVYLLVFQIFIHVFTSSRLPTL